jgi:serralysin
LADPGVKTSIVMENNGSPTSVSYSYNPANTDIDLFGLDPYPIQPEFTGGANYAVIGDAITAAEAEGISQSHIVPVYQEFGPIWMGSLFYISLRSRPAKNRLHFI